MTAEAVTEFPPSWIPRCDLGPGPLAHVLALCAPRDIGRAACACRALRAVAAADGLWRAKALERFPPETVRVDGAPYAT